MVRWVVGSIFHGGPIELFLVPASAPRHFLPSFLNVPDQAAISAKISNFLMCFFTLYLFCTILEKDVMNCFYIVLSCLIK